MCAVDEVRWLDHECADVLAFVARRIEAEPIAFVVALAEENAIHFAVPDPRHVRLSPLAEENARAVVRDVSPAGVSPAVVDRIVRTADGVPLLLPSARDLRASARHCGRSVDGTSSGPQARWNATAIWQLTPQELQIARLVAKGASNRDAAAELFLSPRTVEYHLRKVFTKLGISFRTELVRMTLADELVGSDAGS